MHRFFVSPTCIEGQKVTLVDEVAHQIRNVLRMRAGRKIAILDGSGRVYHVDLVHVGRSVVVGQIFDTLEEDTEPHLHLTLYQGTLKAQKFELVLQKGTEVGISAFVPLISERSVLADVEAVDNKRERWERIICEAAEQSQRGILPVLHSPTMFSQACQQVKQATALNLLAWEDSEALSLRQTLESIAEPPQAINLFIGSEGGFSLDEARLAHGYNIHPVWLGKRIFRAETAGLVATAAIFYHYQALE
jgi:16S rRNA (uracil1498-N3)-methyltransferase